MHSVSARERSRISRTAQPNTVAELFARALALEARGRDAEAQAAYIEVVRRDGTHFDALINLGNLLNRTGYRRAARLAYAEARKAEPNNAIVHVNLGNTFLDTDELEVAREHFEEALRNDPAQPEAHQGMSYLFARLGDEQSAARHRELGFHDRAVMTFPYRGEGAPVHVLLLASALGGNVFTADFLEDRTFETTRVFVDYFGDARLPAHDLVFNAIGDADRCAEALAIAGEMLKRTHAPRINAPQRVLLTGRLGMPAVLGDISHVVAPRAIKLARNAAGVHGLGFPLLVRSLGFHTGKFFTRVEREEDLPDALERLPGEDIAAIEYLDTRGSDGKYRKYRVMAIGGKLYPLHLAISDEWKVHYFTANMSVPEHQAEERRFLEGMAAVLGAPALRALESIAQRLGLDYCGIDFSLDRAGNVVLFEANATMIVPSRETRPELAYRAPYLEGAIAAVRTLLLSSVGRP